MKVYKAINLVQADLSKTGISKEGKNQQQGYSFRGIDQVYGALSGLLSKHQLCILPRVISRIEREGQTKNGGVMLYVVVEVEFDFVSAEDGTKHTIKTFGESCDTSDKATNKALSAAYKYACIQSFCIPLSGEPDADNDSPEVPQAKKPAKQSSEAPGSKVIPFGKIKGKRMNEITEEELRNVVAWMETKNKDGAFNDLLNHAYDYLDFKSGSNLQNEFGTL